MGIVYTRENNPTKGKLHINQLKSIVPAYKDVEFFIQEKFRICGEKRGSGNTDNIGTITSNKLYPFIYGAGPFSYLGEDIFNDYWKHYPRYKDSDKIKSSLYLNIFDYIEWIRKKDKNNADKLLKRYNQYLEFYSEQEKSQWK